MATAKEADLAGPGIGSYEELDRILPADYTPLLEPRETMEALYAAKRLIEDRLCEELNLTMVQVPLVVDAGSGVNDYFLDHDHSAYVDQWDWERAITAEQRTLEYLTETMRSIWKVLREAEALLHERWPTLADSRYPALPDELAFIHAEDILDAYPDLPRKQRETAILREHPASFIYGIGWPLADGLPHELRAADYDDWSTETLSADGRPMHARPERRHPRLEPSHSPPPRAHVGRDPRHEGVARPAARALGPARLPRARLPPGDLEGRDPTLDRGRDRSVSDDDAPPAQGASRRGERQRLARGAQRDVRSP